MVTVVSLFILAALSRESFCNNSTGTRFITAFPENIAYYHPTQATNRIQITVLYNNTLVTIWANGNTVASAALQVGDVYCFNLSSTSELGRQPLYNNTVYITSTNAISVQAMAQKVGSIQTALIMSVDDLGTQYNIPPVPSVSGFTDFQLSNVPERGPFKVIVVNADRANTVTVGGVTSQKMSLLPFELAQLWLTEANGFTQVSATAPVAVLFGHPCALKYACTCAMLLIPLDPTSTSRNFLVPPIMAMNAAYQTSLLLSDPSTRGEVPFDPASPMTTSSTGTLVLYRPGLLLSLIAVEDFSSCYSIYSLTSSDSQLYNRAVIITLSNQITGVRLGSGPLQNPQWELISGTPYSSTYVQLTSSKNIIWHTTSNMAVYFVGIYNNTIVFGNPAPSISKSPDYRGCVLMPEVLQVLPGYSWPDAAQACLAAGLQLAILDTAELQQRIGQQLQGPAGLGQQTFWLGMRRSSLTGDWYWLSRVPVGATQWGLGEPGELLEGQCAMMHTAPSGNFTWSDADCCQASAAVCYQPPMLLPL